MATPLLVYVASNGRSLLAFRLRKLPSEVHEKKQEEFGFEVSYIKRRKIMRDLSPLIPNMMLFLPRRPRIIVQL